MANNAAVDVKKRNLSILMRQVEKVVKGEARGDDTANPFWRGQLEKLSNLIAAKGDDVQLKDIGTALGYRMRFLPEGALNNKALDSIEGTIKHATERVPALAKALHANIGKDKDYVEHVGMLSVLRHQGLLYDYIEFIDNIRIESDMPSARHFFYMKQLQKILENIQSGGPFTFLEVGSGAGNFAYFLHESKFVSSYVFVDLPEMLVNSMTTVTEMFKEPEIYLNEIPPLTPGRFVFLETDVIAQVPDNSIDVALNFNSFMEMDREIRNFYIQHIYRVLKDGGVFFNVNRRQKMSNRDGSEYDNNPLLYPYQTTDEVVMWEPDIAQQGYRARTFYAALESFCITRASVVHKT